MDYRVVPILIAVLTPDLVVSERIRDRRRQRREFRYRRPDHQAQPDIAARGIVAAVRGWVRAFARITHVWQRPPQKVQQRPAYIEVTCPTCKSVLLAPRDMAGKEAACGSCHSIVRVPALPPLMDSSRSAISAPPSLALSRETAPEITVKLLQEFEWKRVEEVVEAYFQRTGWRTKPERIGADGGVNIHLFRAGDQKVAAIAQRKAWKTYKVGVKPIRELFGVMAAESVSQGSFITSGAYTEEARSFARGESLTLIDGEDLVARMRALPKDDRRRIYDIATRGDFRTPTRPRCGPKMVRRIGAKGRGAGVPFWGCPS